MFLAVSIALTFSTIASGYISSDKFLPSWQKSLLRSKNNNVDYNQLVPQNMAFGGLDDIRRLILFEDNNVLVMYKPPTILSQPDKNNNDNLLDACKRYVNTNSGNSYIGLVHRIDRPCSGIIVFSKTSESTAILSEQFQKRTTDKYYLCVVNGYVNDSRICHDKILKTSADKTRIFPDNSTRNDVVDAKLRFKPLKVIEKPKPTPTTLTPLVSDQLDTPSSDALAPATTFTTDSDPVNGPQSPDSDPPAAFQSLLQIELETGRKHQIRAQLAHIGFPVVGDAKYGAPQAFRNRDICLHAFSLTFNHPITKKQLHFRADVPRIWGARFGPAVLDETRRLVHR